ncbi:DsbE family thiol:disulfide interchange protein [Basfia succiniciproducens]|uniref:DsbE family thiol:disulfide interchange protein n=1 Tax=Basfia succiniciproducens TaxID=653940 RepID=UPI0008D0F400|nr:DsbE family thiol:disulfide interchange protein [Basfia succiniciproducens]SEQ45170.1 cytochrome c biogenesis protein CcmG, thiol:disulfide interchange protein DsbE [Basfia succiniciproducens]
MKRKVFLFLPLIVLLVICIFLTMGLKQDPKKIASALIGKPVPEFFQADLLDNNRIISNKHLPKQPYLLNVWGSWCYYCQQEHPLLMELAEQRIPIVGLNYRDKKQGALEMLTKKGNPFALVIDDSRGELAMKLGVDGAPETYVIDENGVIRYRYSGAVDKTILQKEILPEFNKLRN